MSSFLLRQGRHRLLRFFSTSLSPIPESSPRVSTKPHGRRTTKKEFEKSMKELVSSVRRPIPSEFVIQEGIYMEVFDVRIERFDAKRYSRIYGEVKEVMSSWKTYFYNRPKTNPEPVDLGSDLGSGYLSPILLTGPRKFPVTLDEGCAVVSLHIDIKDADTDEEIIKGQFCWGDQEDPCDRLIMQEVRGAYGSAVVSYAVFLEAVSATVEVKLLKGGNLFGVVAASNSSFFQGQSVLFCRYKERSVSLVPQEPVPLSRCLVALPADADLNVRLELWDLDDGQIANTTVTFLSKDPKEGTSYKIISRQIKVTVTWKTLV